MPLDHRAPGRDTAGYRRIPAGLCRNAGVGGTNRPQSSRVPCSARFDRARVDSPGLLRPPERVEYGERVKVIPPTSHLASLDRQHRDVAIGIGCAGRDNTAF